MRRRRKRVLKHEADQKIVTSFALQDDEQMEMLEIL